MSEKLTEEEVMEQIENLNAEYERFSETTAKDILDLIIKEEYPISVALGGLCATIDSIIQVYDMEEFREKCIDLIAQDFQEVE